MSSDGNGHSGAGEHTHGWTSFCGGGCNKLILIAALLVILQFTGLLPRFQHYIMSVLFARMGPHHQKHFNAIMGKRKEALFAEIAKDAGPSGKMHIIEIGAGSGANFKFLPPGTRVSCIEPNSKCEAALRKSVEETNGKVILEEFRVGKAEHMDHIEDNSVDGVICSLVMCSVDSIDGTMKEVKRILRPGGKLYFLEHTVADSTSWERIPQLIALNFMRFMLQKNINREAHVNIRNAGFSEVNMEFYDVPELHNNLSWHLKPFMPTRHFQGTATK